MEPSESMESMESMESPERAVPGLVQPPNTAEQITYNFTSSYLPTPTTASLNPTSFGYDAGIGVSTYVQDGSSAQDPNVFWYNPMATPMLPTPTSMPGSSPNSAAIATTATTTPALPGGEWISASEPVPDPTTNSAAREITAVAPPATPLLPSGPWVPTSTLISTTTATNSATLPSATTISPALQGGDWYQGFTEPAPPAPNPIALALGSSEFPTGPLSLYMEAKMSTNDRERSLLGHFVDNVLRLVFPILDLHKQGTSRAREILRSLDSNKSYYHCSLSVSAIHLRTVKKQRGQRVERDIMRHRYAAISELNKALCADHSHDTILDATLAMIFFHCTVGPPEEDGLLDIAWTDHFSAVTNLVTKLGLDQPTPYIVPPFRLSLSTWIDILGATMLGESPKFAHTYRNKHLKGISSGLRELMGCDDRIMYLISEIACLDSLKESGCIDEYTINHHVTALTAQLDHAEQAVLDPTYENPISATGIIQADKLTKNMTAIFRAAARIYLYSLTPAFHPEQQRITDLVETVATLLQYIPSGPSGFDRSLVWPMLITGAFSTPTSNFRIILEQRISSMGDTSDFGSFGRMYNVLLETWKLTHESTEPTYTDESLLQMDLPSPSIDIRPRIKKQPVHWRVVMKFCEWQYLLL